MKDSVKDRFKRLKRAAQILAVVLDNPDASLTRKAENSGCLDEFEFLLEEMRLWLDDDFYYEDVAWNMINDPNSLTKKVA